MTITLLAGETTTASTSTTAGTATAATTATTLLLRLCARSVCNDRIRAHINSPPEPRWRLELAPTPRSLKAVCHQSRLKIQHPLHSLCLLVDGVCLDVPLSLALLLCLARLWLPWRSKGGAALTSEPSRLPCLGAGLSIAFVGGSAGLLGSSSGSLPAGL